jgi:hypothetical protein
LGQKILASPCQLIQTPRGTHPLKVADLQCDCILYQNITYGIEIGITKENVCLYILDLKRQKH